VANIVIELGDSYAVRKELLALLYKNAQSWFGLAIARAPMEVQVTLQVGLLFNGLYSTFADLSAEISFGAPRHAIAGDH
jgi:hypothetical protein